MNAENITLRSAGQLAAHESSRTARLYDLTNAQIMHNEIEPVIKLNYP
jgi:hypothetical protein